MTQGLRMLTLVVAITALLGGCSAASQPAAPSASAPSTVASATSTVASQPTPTAAAPTISAIPSFDPAAPTLRTVAESPEQASHLTVGKQLSANDRYATHAATYTSDGLTISAVLLEPLAHGRHPGVVVVHGFVDPASYVTGGELRREQDAFARAGYVVLDPDLRGLAGSDPAPSGPPDLEMGATDDVINAVTALATSGRPGLDPARIGLFGHSLGGLLVLDVIVAKPGLVDAAAAFAPSGTDRWADVGLYLTPGDPIYEALIAAHGTAATNPTYWADVSPRTFVDRVTDPLLIVQGDADVDVPPAGTAETVAIWGAAGKDVRLLTLKGENHVFEARSQEAMSAVIAFFAEHLH